MKDLVLIPARGGSRGIPNKNMKFLHGRPLIYYTLDAACAVASPENICVSTDSDEIIRIVREYGLSVPFKRPDYFATDTASSYDVIRHSLEFYEERGMNYNRVILLQPTSPFRKETHIREAISLYQPELDMIASVKISRANPYFNIFEENSAGFLIPSKQGNFSRRQDCPVVYEYNGAIYIINVEKLSNVSPVNFSKIKKYVMADEESIDLDTPLDWLLAEAVMRQGQRRDTV